MKFHQLAWSHRDEGETLAVFGNARLIKYLDGEIELRGGSPDDYRAARGWCSLFMPQGVAACAA